ncbi:hypothetical protein [Chitinophaga agri]|uniref:Uncharacterized protein n=1 Tax=Chitinophaga agri TaxID=2703787 RepID=A0A6B9Z879_9BACT|nr:hypothetical protein [Chitinophaga agri]QHS58166.1 hypothetical protein GWR21_00710 [Chitinophaga agri]
MYYELTPGKLRLSEQRHIPMSIMLFSYIIATLIAAIAFPLLKTLLVLLLEKLYAIIIQHDY